MAGRVLILAPHQDDEVLGCGGVLAALGDARSVHVAYATDGSASPAPAGGISQAGSRLLGVPGRNAHFLDLPDSRLSQHRDELGRRLRDLLARVDPDRVFVPFRYDQNPDHQALYGAAVHVLGAAAARRVPELIEYFVYPRMKLLPCGDVRALINQKHLVRVNTLTVAENKREALRSYESQTTIF